MDFIDRIQRRFGKFAIPNSMYYLIAGQAVVFLLTATRPDIYSQLMLTGNRVLAGEVWRLVTFLFLPFTQSLIFLFLSWYFYYLIGNQLESEWGSFRFIVYLLLSYIGLVIFSLLFPQVTIDNIYLFSSLFLAYAYLYPEQRMLMFFLIPMKVKWLGWLSWFGIGLSFLSGGFTLQLLILVSLINYFIFFGKDIWGSLVLRRKSLEYKAVHTQVIRKPNHICAVCGKNEVDNPDMQIRYCEQCSPATCYCGEHIDKHTHIAG